MVHVSFPLIYSVKDSNIVALTPQILYCDHCPVVRCHLVEHLNYWSIVSGMPSHWPMVLSCSSIVPRTPIVLAAPIFDKLHLLGTFGSFDTGVRIGCPIDQLLFSHWSIMSSMSILAFPHLKLWLFSIGKWHLLMHLDNLTAVSRMVGPFSNGSFSVG